VPALPAPALTAFVLRPWLARSGEDHHRVDLAEDYVNTAADTGHDGDCRNSDERREQSILDEILTTMVTPDLPLN